MPAINIPRLPEYYEVFVCGPVLSGKSWITEQWALQKERVIVADLTASFIGDKYEHFWSDREGISRRLAKNPHYYRISYHVNPDDKEKEFEFLYLCNWTLTKPRWFFVDECQEYFGESLAPGAENILRYCRHNKLGLVAASQRVAGIDKLLTGGARIVVLFYTPEFRDLEAIQNNWGREVRQCVEKLRPCIYNETTKVLEQAPECLLYLKGVGYKVIPLGDKIASGNSKGESQQWEEVLAGAPTKQAQQSSGPISGSPESRSPESISAPINSTSETEETPETSDNLS